MSPRVVFTPEAQDQLAELFRYIATAGSADVAARYTEAIVAYCEELAAFPHRGRARDDIRPGLRTIRTGNALAVSLGPCAPKPAARGRAVHDFINRISRLSSGYADEKCGAERTCFGVA